jgi:Family of unknown function (DUF6527)
MADKIHDVSHDSVVQVFAFHCPGCGYDHAFTVGPQYNEGSKRPRWDWNGSFEQPTFTPSLRCNGGTELECHLFMTQGALNYCVDSVHELAGKIVAVPDWEGWEGKKNAV